MSLHFATPWWLLLFFTLIPLIHWERSSLKAIKVSHLPNWQWDSPAKTRILSHLLFALRMLTISCMILGLARPQFGRSHTKPKTEGLDIMLVIDTSGSMKALDFKIDGQRVDRLVVVKNVLRDFIAKRTDDRLGLVVFGTQAFAQAPLTLDHDVLLNYIDSAEIGMAGDSTAIGDALGVAVNRLKDIEAKSKVIILLTDGSNTAGKIDPIQAASAAKALNVKIYSIGIGSHGPVPIQTELGLRNVILDLDETLLKLLAETTHGKYFVSSNTETLKDVYDTIDQLEKSSVEITVFHNYAEKFPWFVWPALGFLLLELMLRTTRVRRIP